MNDPYLWDDLDYSIDESVIKYSWVIFADDREKNQKSNWRKLLLQCRLAWLVSKLSSS